MPRRLRPQPEAGTGRAESGHRADRTGQCLIHRLVFGSGVDADLIDLLLPDAALHVRSFEDIAHREPAARDLHVRQPRALRVTRNLEYSCAKVIPIARRGCVPADPLQQLRDPLRFKRGSEKTRIDPALLDQGSDCLVPYAAFP